jgi:hypothetical protein
MPYMYLGFLVVEIMAAADALMTMVVAKSAVNHKRRKGC